MLSRVETTLVGKLVCVPVDLVAGIGDALLEYSFMTRQRGSETGSRYFRARLTGDREERWAVYEFERKKVASAEPNRKPNHGLFRRRQSVWPCGRLTPQKDFHHLFPCPHSLPSQFSTLIYMLAHLVSNLPRRAVPSARRAISVQVLPASPRARSRALTVSAIRAQSILHGSKEAKEAGDHEIQQHSRLVARGKYLHGIESASQAYEKRLNMDSLNCAVPSSSSQARQCQGI
jgi:hypothetical protein